MNKIKGFGKLSTAEVDNLQAQMMRVMDILYAKHSLSLWILGH